MNRTSAPVVTKNMNCLLCKKKILSSYNEVRHHVNVCLFSTGAYQQFLPPKQGPNKVKIGDIDEYGQHFTYKCQVEDCEESLPKKKAMGYRQYSMHCGAKHGILERWAKDSTLAGAQELYHAIKNWREEAGETLPAIPDYKVKEVHACLLCHGEGEGGRETKTLSFDTPDNVQTTRYHYANCLFDYGGGVYLKKYKPHPGNLDEDGKLNDLLGTTWSYYCKVCPSKKSRKMGYKEYTSHMAKEHGGLEEILSEHKDEKVRQLLTKFRNSEC